MSVEPLKVLRTPRPRRDQAIDGPVWGCDCGTILAASSNSPTRVYETVCNACARRYGHRQIGQGAWRVVLLPAGE